GGACRPFRCVGVQAQSLEDALEALHAQRLTCRLRPRPDRDETAVRAVDDRIALLAHVDRDDHGSAIAVDDAVVAGRRRRQILALLAGIAWASDGWSLRVASRSSSTEVVAPLVADDDGEVQRIDHMIAVEVTCARG